MNRVKTDSRASLGEKRLNSLIRIVIEGPSLENFDVMAAMNLWANDCIRRPNQSPQTTYKPRDKKDRAVTLMDIDEADEVLELDQ